jgi:hypothetical protein
VQPFIGQIVRRCDALARGRQTYFTGNVLASP